MKIRNESVEYNIQKAIQDNNIKCTVLGEGNSGMLREFFGKDKVKIGRHTVNSIDTISTHIELELLENVNNEKIRISSTSERFMRDGEYKMYKEFMEEHGITRNLINSRITIIMGLAISSLVQHSEFSIYIGNEYKKNIVYSRLGSTIITGIPIHVFSSQNDINQRISAVFNYLWFNDVNNYTGYDQEIVEFSLRNWDKIR